MADLDFSFFIKAQRKPYIIQLKIKFPAPVVDNCRYLAGKIPAWFSNGAPGKICFKLGLALAARTIHRPSHFQRKRDNDGNGFHAHAGRQTQFVIQPTNFLRQLSQPAVHAFVRANRRKYDGREIRTDAATFCDALQQRIEVAGLDLIARAPQGRANRLRSDIADGLDQLIGRNLVQNGLQMRVKVV